MTRVALYARYSSDRQNERSIADQLAVLTRHAADKGWTIVGVHTDAAISGSAMANRPGLLAALDAADRDEFDLLLAEDEDRLARNLEHLAHIANRLADVGAAIATLSTDRVLDMHVAFKGLIAQDYIRNLSQKTRRGMASNAEKGLATGSRLYGYRSQPGGALTIVEEEAAVIRRIFRMYAIDLLTCRDIADALNRVGVPSPAGRLWNASTIAGSAQRANGILHTELYAGVKVYGRVEMRKDRRTGRRLTIVKPETERQRIEVPHLAIIDRDLWARVQARKSGRATRDPAQRARMKRQPHVLSGLLKCGRCGASYTSLSAGRLVCAAYREKGRTACSNNRHVSRAEVERRVLGGLSRQLLTPEAVALYVRAYHQAWQAEVEARADRRQPLEKRLAEIQRQIRRLVDAIAQGELGSRSVAERLAQLEAEETQAQAQLQEIDRAANELPVQLHPRAAETYARKVEDIHTALAAYAASGEPASQAVTEAVRDLIERIEIEPMTDQARAPIRIQVIGTLARFMEQNAPQCGGALVAGGGLEPPTCGL